MRRVTIIRGNNMKEREIRISSRGRRMCETRRRRKYEMRRRRKCKTRRRRKCKMMTITR